MYDHSAYMLYNAQLAAWCSDKWPYESTPPSIVKVLVNSKHVHSLIPSDRGFVKLRWAFP